MTLPETSAATAYRRILMLALPIIGGMVSQNVLNLVDTWMVGKTGTASLAAVSAGGMVNFLAVATVMGLSAGVQAVAARRQGQGAHGESAEALNGAILLALVVGLPLTALFVGLAPEIFRRLHPDPAVVAVGAPYLTYRMLALAPSGLNFAFRGYWNGTNRSHLYLITLLVIHTANILLNWVLIFGKWGIPAQGAPGAGMASAIATSLGCACYFLLGVTHASANGFLKRWPSMATIKGIFHLALPTGIQQFLFAGGMTTLFWIVGRLGTRETAAAGVLVTVMLVAILPPLGLGITAASLVSQALGASEPRRAHLWGWQVSHVAVAASLVVGLPMVFASAPILSFFIQDPEVARLAVWPLRLFALGTLLDGGGTVFQQALLGAGANRQVMVVSVACQWLLFLPAAYLLGPILGFGLVAIWAAQAGYRILQSSVYVYLWQRQNWTNIKL